MYIWACSKKDIEQRFPEFYVFEEPPRRFINGEGNSTVERLTSDLDEPADWLVRYVESEQKTNSIFKNPSLKKPFVDW